MSTGNNNSFGQFVLDSQNRFAYTAAGAVAKKPGEIYNPLIIYGDKGLGKTFLLNSIKNTVAHIHPQKSCVLMEGKAFETQYCNAKVNNTLLSFIDYYYNLDILLLDDVQKFFDNPYFRVFMPQLISQYQAVGSQIVLTSDHSLHRALLPLVLGTPQLSKSLTVDICPATVEDKKRYLNHKAVADYLKLTPETMHFLEEELSCNIYLLSRICHQLATYQMTHKQEAISLELCHEIIKIS